MTCYHAILSYFYLLWSHFTLWSALCSTFFSALNKASRSKRIHALCGSFILSPFMFGTLLSPNHLYLQIPPIWKGDLERPGTPTPPFNDPDPGCDSLWGPPQLDIAGIGVSPKPVWHFTIRWLCPPVPVRLPIPTNYSVHCVTRRPTCRVFPHTESSTAPTVRGRTTPVTPMNPHVCLGPFHTYGLCL